MPRIQGVRSVTREDRLQSLSIVVYDGHFDKIHYALAMASSAAAIDTNVTLFFTMDARMARYAAQPR